MATTRINGQHANPLTLWAPVKQNWLSQLALWGFLKIVGKGGGLNDKDPGHFLHFVRFAGIPNLSGRGKMGLLLLTDFDQPMTPYLNYFYRYVSSLRHAFILLYFIATKPPISRETQSVFEQYLTANNLSGPNSISFSYNASVAQILRAFPPAKTGSSASALTLWIPVEQDASSQEKVAILLNSVQQGTLITDDAQLIHYSRIAGVPGDQVGIAGVLVAVEFDGSPDTFMDYFYTRPEIKDLFSAMYTIALRKPQLPNTATNFKLFAAAHNLPTTPLLYAYRATVAEITAHFSPNQKSGPLV